HFTAVAGQVRSAARQRERSEHETKDDAVELRQEHRGEDTEKTPPMRVKLFWMSHRRTRPYANSAACKRRSQVEPGGLVRRSVGDPDRARLGLHHDGAVAGDAIEVAARDRVDAVG